ncbi:MAG: hypothetical protein OXS28_00905 [Gammaproteobacteria bacterium]|nr:hypothetical protein [Gammaproteobacteria bacterium]
MKKSKGRSEEAALEPTARCRRVSKRILAPNRCIYKRLSWSSLASPDPEIFAGEIIDNIESYGLDFDSQKRVLRRNNRQKWDIN